jgi:hypothetical protein
MLLVRVYCDLGIAAPLDPRPYTRDWFIHRNEERYLGLLLGHSRQVKEPTGIGDVMVFRIGRCYAHAGIISRLEPLTIIHAFSNAGRVVEDVIGRSELNARRRVARFTTFWG